jgi:hypothetical protein
LGLLAALHPASPTTLIGYEEPENGVHPARLKLVADLFKNAWETYGKQMKKKGTGKLLLTYLQDLSSGLIFRNMLKSGLRFWD